MKIFVTGLGVVSAIGDNAQENLSALKSMTTGIRRSTESQLMTGTVNLTNEQIIGKLNLPTIDYSRTSLLGALAASEAYRNHRHHDLIRTGLISATSVGGMDRMEGYYAEYRKHPQSGVFEKMTHDNGRTTERIAEYLNITGYIGTISTACSSGANAIMMGARLIQSDRLDRVVVGGVDPLAQFDVKGFSSLNIYDPNICKPFDDQRRGLNLGEGAGFMVLENEKSISLTGSEKLGVVAGWSNATDAFHQTASSAEGKGAYLTMVNALAKAHLTPDQIDYVNAHGTGTGNNDLSESTAIMNVFGERIPPFSSTKGFTGHTLAAAGAIEAVYCIMSLQEQALLPNLNFSVPMRETGLSPVTSFSSKLPLAHVLSNSFGFGGNCTSLIFSRVE